MTSLQSRRCPLEGNYWPSELINTLLLNLWVVRDITLPKIFLSSCQLFYFLSAFHSVKWLQCGNFRDQSLKIMLTWTLWSQKLIHKILINVSIPQRKHNCVSIANIKWLMLFKEITAIYSENYMKLTNTICWQNAELWIVKAKLHMCFSVWQKKMVTPILVKTNSYWLHFVVANISRLIKLIIFL